MIAGDDARQQRQADEALGARFGFGLWRRQLGIGLGAHRPGPAGSRRKVQLGIFALRVRPLGGPARTDSGS
jgi:hypothetical protein